MGGIITARQSSLPTATSVQALRHHHRRSPRCRECPGGKVPAL